MQIHHEILEDETDLIQSGYSQERHLSSLNIGESYSSSWTRWPSRYKFFSLLLNVNDEVTVVNRQTYDLLTYLGDIGGLLEIV